MGELDLDVKARILLAAKHLFASKGYDGTSVRQICDSASANIALISYHFGGKEQLFHALLVKYFPIRQLKEMEQLKGSPVKALEYYIEQVSDYRAREPEMIRIIKMELEMNSPRLVTIQEHMFPLWLELKRILEQGKREGVFQYDCLSRTTFYIISMMLFNPGGQYWSPLFDDDEEAHKKTHSQEFTQFVKRALCVRE